MRALPPEPGLRPRRGASPGRVAWLALLLLPALVTSGARAAAPRLRVDVDPCVEVPPAAVERFVAVELDALVVEARADRGAAALDTTRVTIGCAGGLLRIVVEDPLSGTVLSRRIDPRRESDAGRARLLALSVVELVAASWIELGRAGAPAAVAVDATASPEARARAAASAARLVAAPPAAPELRLELFASTRGFSRPFARSFGVGLGIARGLSRGLALAGDLTLEAGARAVSAGEVRAQLGSASLAALARTALGPVGLEAGVGGRLGLVRLTGRPAADRPEATGGGGTRPWGGPLLAARAGLQLGGGLRAALGVEAGVVALPVEGTVGTLAEVALRGVWLQAVAGLALVR